MFIIIITIIKNNLQTGKQPDQNELQTDWVMWQFHHLVLMSIC